jgi:NitT/TauT family transport system ATP-binding protein
MAPFIQAQSLTLSFRPKNREPVTALTDFSLSVAQGEFVSVVGPSGCGKSTFLNILLGLIKHDRGTLEFNGRPITGPGQERAMVFQEFGLLPWRTVAANVELGLEIKGTPAAERAKHAGELINLVGLNGFENHYPHELSGGMKQQPRSVAQTRRRL